MRLIAVALASLAVAAAAAPASEDHWDARLAAVRGEVVVRPADGGGDAAAETGMPLEEGDAVVVPANGSAEVALDGGSLITVLENSEFKVEKTAKGDASFFLRVGSLLAKIQKLGEARLRVRTPTAVAAVRGTDFGVAASAEETCVGVFDQGKVEVAGDSGAPETLISNQETSVMKGKAPLHATQLRRFVRHRALMRAHARRVAAIRVKWKALPEGSRRELRRAVIERMRAHHLKRLEKRSELLKKRGDVGSLSEEKQKQRRSMLENRRKMEERRRGIQRRGVP